MKFIKEITIDPKCIHIHFMKGTNINEYQMQLLNKESGFISMYKEKRSKLQIVYETYNLCSLQNYLRSTSLQEGAFLKLLVDLLEKINELQKDYYVHLSIETIFLTFDGMLCFLVLPISKEGYIAIDEEVQHVLADIVKEVQVKQAYAFIGMLVQNIKSPNFRMLTLLQELHQQMPEEISIPFWKRFFFKAEVEDPISYPSPIRKQTTLPREEYIEEIEDSGNETMLLFEQKIKAGYLENGSKRMSIERNEFHIGRNPDSDCYLNVPSVSKRHALIVQEEDSFYIKDLKSSNATFVNGKKLKPDKLYELKDNDAITLGNTILEFHES